MAAILADGGAWFLSNLSHFLYLIGLAIYAFVNIYSCGLLLDKIRAQIGHLSIDQAYEFAEDVRNFIIALVALLFCLLCVFSCSSLVANVVQA